MKLIKLFILIAAISFTAVSCTDDFDDMNQNPMKATSLPTEYSFTHSQLVYGAYRYSEFRANLILTSPFAGLTNSIYSVGRGFKNNDEYNASKWGQAYKGEIKDIQDVIYRLEDTEENSNLLASARVLRVFYFLRLTDLYGDIPYFQGGKGYIENIVNPVYDKQEDIYNDFIKELTEANNQFDAANTKTYGSNDLLFGGDVAKWKKFTNSLLLRVGMRLTKVNPALAESTVKKAIANGVMSTYEDQAYVTPILDGQWGIHENGTSNGYRAENGRQYPSKELVDHMLESKDPRVFVYLSKCYLNPADGYMPYALDPEDDYRPFAKSYANNGSFNDSTFYVGYPSGASSELTTEYFVKTDTAAGDPQYHAKQWRSYITKSADVDDVYTYLNPETVMNKVTPVIYMSFAEVKFLLAEAAYRGWSAGTAKGLYEDGIRMAMKMSRELYPGQEYVTRAMAAANNFDYNAGIDQYINSPIVAWDNSKGLELIAVEKWKTFINNGYEAFAEWRRTGFPSFVKANPDTKDMRPVYYYNPVTKKVDFSNKIEDKEIEVLTGTSTENVRPRRLTYPNKESAINKEAYDNAVSLLKHGNDYRSRVWWDAK